jgi:hypothetical protein
MCTWLWSTAMEETLQTILMVNIVLFSGSCYYQIIFQVPVPFFWLSRFSYLTISCYPSILQLFYLSAGVAGPDPRESALI